MSETTQELLKSMTNAELIGRYGQTGGFDIDVVDEMARRLSSPSPRPTPLMDADEYFGKDISTIKSQPTPDLGTLREKILDMPWPAEANERAGYGHGFNDARHAAASLVAAHGQPATADGSNESVTCGICNGTWEYPVSMKDEVWKVIRPHLESCKHVATFSKGQFDVRWRHKFGREEVSQVDAATHEEALAVVRSGDDGYAEVPEILGVRHVAGPKNAEAAGSPMSHRAGDEERTAPLSSASAGRMFYKGEQVIPIEGEPGFYWWSGPDPRIGGWYRVAEKDCAESSSPIPSAPAAPARVAGEVVEALVVAQRALKWGNDEMRGRAPQHWTEAIATVDAALALAAQTPAGTAGDEGVAK